jgi:hypothetical protein
VSKKIGECEYHFWLLSNNKRKSRFREYPWFAFWPLGPLAEFNFDTWPPWIIFKDRWRFCGASEGPPFEATRFKFFVHRPMVHKLTNPEYEENPYTRSGAIVAHIDTNIPTCKRHTITYSFLYWGGFKTSKSVKIWRSTYFTITIRSRSYCVWQAYRTIT